ncbi:hypothetical protein D3C71_1407840 [compost metagenome]
MLLFLFDANRQFGGLKLEMLGRYKNGLARAKRMPVRFERIFQVVGSQLIDRAQHIAEIERLAGGCGQSGCCCPDLSRLNDRGG